MYSSGSADADPKLALRFMFRKLMYKQFEDMQSSGSFWNKFTETHIHRYEWPYRNVYRIILDHNPSFRYMKRSISLQMWFVESSLFFSIQRKPTWLHDARARAFIFIDVCVQNENNCNLIYLVEFTANLLEMCRPTQIQQCFFFSLFQIGNLRWPRWI